MAKIIADRVLETSTTTGTGAYTLAGAVTGFRAFSTVCANADTVEYYAEDVDSLGTPLGGWEVGLGTWGTGGILTRTTIYASSNANAAVSWAAGTRRVALGLTATSLSALAPIASPVFTGTVSFSGGVANFTNGTSNRLMWGNNGVAAPTFTSYSAGVKAVLYDSIDSANTGYTLGIEGSTLYFTVGTTGNQFKWYGGTTSAATLSGTGNFVATGSVTGTALIPSGSTVPTNGLYLPSANVIALSTNTTERVRIDSAGQVGIGVTPSVARSLTVGKVITGATTAFGVVSNGTIQSDVTASYTNFVSAINTQAATFTVPTVIGYSAQANALGANSAITSQYGFYASSTLTGASNNYGFYGEIASAAGRWNLYMAGTADNAFAGNLRVGSTAAPTVALDVQGDIKATGTVTTTGGAVLGPTVSIGAGFNTNAGVELGYTGGSATTSYIDFHSGATATDYDSRIAATGGNGSTGQGTLTFTAATNTFNGDLGTFKSTGIPKISVTSAQAAGFAPAQLQLWRYGASGAATPDSQTLGELRFDALNTGAAYSNVGMISVVSGTNSATGTPGSMFFATSDGSTTSATTRMTLSAAGNLGIGNSSPAVILDVRGTQANFARFSTDAAPFYEATLKYRGTAGAPTTVAAADVISSKQFYAYDGTANRQAASIDVVVSATPATSTVSGYMSFLTTPTGTSQVPVERMRIGSGGNIGVGSASLGQIFEITKNQNAGTVAVVRNTDAGAAAQSILQLTSSAKYVNFVLDPTSSYLMIAGLGGTVTKYERFNTYYWQNAAGNADLATLDSSGNFVSTASCVSRTNLIARPTTSTHGFIHVQGGNATNSGYVEFYSHTGGVRQGYIGFSATNATSDAGTLPYLAGTHLFTGTIDCNSNLQSGATDGVGHGLWNSTPTVYGMGMSGATNVTHGGRISGETTSDYNIYFTIGSGTNRGFMFRNSYSTPLFAINTDAVRSAIPISVNSIVTTANVAGLAPAINITGGASTATQSGNSGGVVIKGGDVSTAAIRGGPIYIQSGAGNTSGAGGTVTILGGSGGATGLGAEVTIKGGNGGATSGSAGTVSIIGGTSTTSSAAGLVSITGGVSTSSGGGGAVNITSGNSVSGGSGTISLVTPGGQGVNSAGTITIQTGQGGSTSGQGGNIYIFAGGSYGVTGGRIDLTAGDGIGAAIAGGAVNILAGNGSSNTTAAIGGAVIIKAGNSGTIASGSGGGGAVNITAGVGNGLNSAGTPGAVVIAAGAAQLAGQAGANVTISASDGFQTTTNSAGGTLTLNAGRGAFSSGNNGSIILNALGSAGGTRARIDLNINSGSTGEIRMLANSVEKFKLTSEGVCSYIGFEVGFREIPQNSQSAAYTLVLADSGKHILHPSADTTARTFTIPANASVAFPIGTAVTFINQNAGGVITIAITTDVMRLAGAGTTGSRTLAANGIATAIKITATEWIISGTGLT